MKNSIHEIIELEEACFNMHSTFDELRYRCWNEWQVPNISETLVIKELESLVESFTFFKKEHLSSRLSELRSFLLGQWSEMGRLNVSTCEYGMALSQRLVDELRYNNGCINRLPACHLLNGLHQDERSCYRKSPKVGRKKPSYDDDKNLKRIQKVIEKRDDNFKEIVLITEDRKLVSFLFERGVVFDHLHCIDEFFRNNKYLKNTKQIIVDSPEQGKNPFLLQSTISRLRSDIKFLYLVKDKKCLNQMFDQEMIPNEYTMIQKGDSHSFEMTGERILRKVI